MPDSDVELTRRAYQAFEASDMTGLADLLAPDVVWHVGGDSVLSGSYHGRDAAFAYFGEMFEATEGTMQIDFRSAVELEPGTVLAVCRISAQAHGASYDEEVIQMIRMRNGQGVSCRTYLENGHLWDAVLGRRVIQLPGQSARQDAYSS